MSAEHDVHPLAMAAINFFSQEEGSTTQGKADFLEHLTQLLDLQQPVQLPTVLDDLLIASRFLRSTGMPQVAKQLADCVKIASNRAIVRAGAIAALSAPSDAGSAHISQIVREHELTPAGQAHGKKQSRAPNALHERWADMSDERRRRLAEIADAFLCQTGRQSAG